MLFVTSQLIFHSMSRLGRYLKIASSGPFRLSASLKAEQLSKCGQLEELFLGGFRGRDLESFCRSCPNWLSLKSLTIECDPYFNLGSFSHNTGTHMASLPASWLSSCPNLERLVCDYLKLEMSSQAGDWTFLRNGFVFGFQRTFPSLFFFFFFKKKIVLFYYWLYCITFS